MVHRGPIAARIAAVVVLLATLAGCNGRPTAPTPEISRERAIQIARTQATFEPTTIDARADVRQSTPVWIVTFRAADGSHGGYGQFMEVTLHRSDGTVLSIARS